MTLSYKKGTPKSSHRNNVLDFFPPSEVPTAKIGSSPTQVKIESICPAAASKGKPHQNQHLSIFG